MEKSKRFWSSSVKTFYIQKDIGGDLDSYAEQLISMLHFEIKSYGLQKTKIKSLKKATSKRSFLQITSQKTYGYVR